MTNEKELPLSEEQTVTTPEPVAVPTEPTCISDADALALERARMHLKLITKDSERALAENKSAEMQYKYLVLQVYLKYGLKENDALDEQGNIHRNVKNNTPTNG